MTNRPRRPAASRMRFWSPGTSSAASRGRGRRARPSPRRSRRAPPRACASASRRSSFATRSGIRRRRGARCRRSRRRRPARARTRARPRPPPPRPPRRRGEVPARRHRPRVRRPPHVDADARAQHAAGLDPRDGPAARAREHAQHEVAVAEQHLAPRARACACPRARRGSRPARGPPGPARPEESVTRRRGRASSPRRRAADALLVAGQVHEHGDGPALRATPAARGPRAPPRARGPVRAVDAHHVGAGRRSRRGGPGCPTPVPGSRRSWFAAPARAFLQLRAACPPAAPTAPSSIATHGSEGRGQADSGSTRPGADVAVFPLGA